MALEQSAEEDIDLAATDLLPGFDLLVKTVVAQAHDSAERGAQELCARQEFLDAYNEASKNQVIPAMRAVLERMEAAGGGGLIEEHPGGEARFLRPGVALWMSFEGAIVGGPRPDRHPYLELQADADRRQVLVSEGDKWRGGGGGQSGRAGEWELSDLTRRHVTQELLDIGRRAAA